jgi:hypothetical protein
MNYSMHLLLTLATLPAPRGDDDPASPETPLPLADVLAPTLQRLQELLDAFRAQPLSPARARDFERQLQDTLREGGRALVQHTYNHLEPAHVGVLPKHVHWEATAYTRLNAKTAQNAWTLFGPIRLWRVGYRPTDKGGDPTLFPLPQALGLVHGASAALAEQAARVLGEAGMTQQRTLERLRQDHAVGWGVKKLRQVTEAVAAAVAEHRHDAQVERLRTLLEQASAGTGKHKPVLSVGRDGITLGIRCKGFSVFEVASTGTVSVLDRRGKRLGTVYLAYTPEPGQGTLSRQLTRLLRGLLRRWQGPLPRLCYVTDAGDNETTYYDKVLSRLTHPRTGAALEWIRVVDYYHASERVWTLSELLFGKGQRGVAWARKMQKWLLQPGGVNRVLHSAAAWRTLNGVPGKKGAEFGKAYRYLRERMRFMNYAEYRRLGVPLGSGVTEAGCKTVYTQRLKLSGMRWRKAGAQTILNLRVLLLSGVWDEAYARMLEGGEEVRVGGQRDFHEIEAENAA